MLKQLRLRVNRQLLLVYLVLAPLAHAWLYSFDTEIRSAETYLPVRLRCINWYGAHMESFVAVGLDKRSCGAMADSIVSIGSNCVRIPLSVELVIHNPTPNASAIAGLNTSECNVSTALEVLDCQVRALTQRGLMVILNNHVSFAGWVGANEKVPQGLWHTPRFPTRDWVASLVALASRYRDNPLVVGIDIRNEIHDQDGTVITWGRSNDTDSDWKAATVIADAAIREANPEVLVIVSGLCRSYDLRAMQDLQNYRSKYVFTTHVYTFSWWFTKVDWVLVFWLALLFVAGNLFGVYYLRRRQHVMRAYVAVRNSGPAWPYVFAGAVLFPVYAVVVSLVWMQQAKQVGCSSIADDANITLYLGIFGFFVVTVALLVLKTCENVISWSRLLICFCAWNACLGAVQAGLSVFYQTYGAVLWDLRRWHSSNIPVWVGEFGTVVGDTSEAWGWLMTYIRDMHYAYWPLNGCSQFETFMETSMNVSNGYGILRCDSSTVRNVNWTKTIFPI
jgi:hypothetical protein